MVDLLFTAFAPDSSNASSLACIGALARLFARLQPFKYTRVTVAAAPQVIQAYQRWLRSQYDDYLRGLLSLVRGRSSPATDEKTRGKEQSADEEEEEEEEEEEQEDEEGGNAREDAALHAFMDMVVAESEYVTLRDKNSSSSSSSSKRKSQKKSGGGTAGASATTAAVVVATGPKVASGTLARLLTALLDGRRDREALVSAFCETYLALSDIRCATLQAIPAVLERLAEQDRAALRRAGQHVGPDEAHLSPFIINMISNAYGIAHAAVDHVPVDPEAECSDDTAVVVAQDEAGVVSGPLARAGTHRRAYGATLLALLDYQLPDDVFKDILLSVNDAILPRLPKPRALMDFLVDTYDHGGTLALLALEGLFTLILQHGLDYPDFYTKLYGFLRPRSFTLATGRDFSAWPMLPCARPSCPLTWPLPSPNAWPVWP